MFGAAGYTVGARASVARVTSLLGRLQPRGPGGRPTPLVRIGPNHDGGYLLPDDFDGMSVGFSGGVGDEIRFDIACAARGIAMHLADGTVDDPPARPARSTFTRLNLGAYDGTDQITLPTWIGERAAEEATDMLLKLDIEGAEYATLLACPTQTLARFRMIVLEAHDLARLWEPAFLRVAEAMFGHLLVSHVCVHAHPNNAYRASSVAGLEIPPFMEFTFLRRDRGDTETWLPVTSFPHPLDLDNIVGERTVLVPAPWRSNRR